MTDRAVKRVAITGVGMVSAAGHDVASSWEAVRDGVTAIRALHGIARQDYVSCRIAAQVADFDPASHFPARRLSALDRFSQFAVVAAREAFAQSGLERDSQDVREAACIVGVGVGGIGTLDDSYYRLYGEDTMRMHPLTVPRLMFNAAPSQVTIDLGIKGMSYAVGSACASGTHAIGQAFLMVRSGAVKVAVAGGSEACITAGTIAGWEALRVLSSDTCRPFSKNRNGLVLGEGAAMLVLEDFDHATARGATILAEVIGFGGNADAGDLTSPDETSIAAAMSLALRDAGLDPGQVGYINAHGTGTAINDQTEARAIRQVFGEAPPPVSSSKGVLGHCLGAAGAMEAVVTVMALARQVVPPTANCTEPDEALGIDMVPDGPREAHLGAAMSNSFAFGGLNAVLIFGKV